MVYALRDVIGANLDRIQIVKGWLDADGSTQEKVYDAVWSGDRTIGADGRLPGVGSTVDVAHANWTNTIGASELTTVWADPDFDPAQKAFYYARVIEIPTPRWSTYDAFRLGVELPEGAPTSHPGARLHVADLVLTRALMSVRAQLARATCRPRKRFSAPKRPGRTRATGATRHSPCGEFPR